MARLLKRTGKNLYVDGFHLLGLCEKLIAEAAEEAAAGSGTPADPYTMVRPGQWIARFRPSGKEDDVYYKLQGRLICKNKKLYMGDVGPAYLAAHSQDEAVEKAKQLRLKDTTTRPGGMLPVATFDDQAKQAWLKRNTIDDPTYRYGAQRIVDPGLIYEDSTKALVAAGGEGPSPWTDIRHSPVLAKAIRTMLSGGKLSLTGPNGGYDKHYSRKQFMLPVFALAIFLAEPARNRRAWPINLMLLDLAETGAQGYTWEAILWHPEAINPAMDKRVRTHVMGPQGKEANERTLGQITNTDRLHLVGGLLPASPTGGGERGKPALFQPPKPLHPMQIQRGMQQGPGRFMVSLPFDFIHQKEIDVLLRWLLHIPAIGAAWSIYQGDQVPEDELIDSTDVLRATVTNDLDTTQRLVAIRAAIQQRITSFVAM